VITTAGEGYGTTYFLSPPMEENYAVFEEIMKRIWKSRIRREREWKIK